MAAPPPLPSRFPCWCRAVYSWGGEGKRDLGFIEGDLIECLNAGDGSWWTGRLYRDRRTVGSFPSNFVEVLPESFRPAAPQTSRNTIPANNAPTPGATGAAKSKSFRKPFEAYAKAPHYTTAKQPITYIGGGQPPPKNDPPKAAVARKSIVDRTRVSSPAVSNMSRTGTPIYGNQISRSPAPQQSYGPRSVSPAPPPQHNYGPRAVSPAPLQGYPPVSASPSPGYGARSVSPAPPHGYIPREGSPAVQGYHTRSQGQYNMSQSGSPAPQQYGQRSVSPALQHRQSYLPLAVSPAPPPPTQEMVNYNYRRAASPAPFNPYNNQMQKSASPVPLPGHHYSNSMQMYRSTSPAPYRDDYSMQREPSPAPQYYRQDSRAYSPGPNNYQSYSRAASPSPLAGYGSQQDQYRRAASPAPLRQNSYDQRAVSPVPYQQQYGRSVSPVPPPPTHYSTYNTRSPSPGPTRAYQTETRFRPYSPAPPVSNQQLMQFQPATDGPSGGAPPPIPPPHRQMTRQGSVTSYMGGQDLSRQVSNQSYMGGQELVRQTSAQTYDQRPPMSRKGSQISYLEQQQQQAPPPQTTGPPLASSRFRAYSTATPSQLATATPPQSRFQPQTPRAASPLPPNMTPSPLREAMDGVMEQLETLRMSRVMNGDEVAPVWGPDSFDMVTRQSRKESNARPQTAMGLSVQDSGYETWSGESSQTPSQVNSQAQSQTAPPQDEEPIEKSPLPELSSYVERMEKSLEQMHEQVPVASTTPSPVDEVGTTPKALAFERPKSSMSLARDDDNVSNASLKKIRARKSAYDVLNRTATTKTTSTNASSGNQSTITQNSDRSLMSGVSAGGISATSAGSFEKRRGRAQSALGVRGEADMDRPDSPFTGVSYHSSHASNAPGSPTKEKSPLAWQDEAPGLGGLVQPKTPKRNIFKKLLDSAKTSVASNRNSIAFNSDKHSPSRSPLRSSPTRNLHTSAGGSTINLPGTAALAFGHRSSPFSRSGGRDAGLASQNKAVDWVQVRRDVNRSNSLSRIERTERLDRARMLDYPSIDAVEELYTTYHGDEGADGNPVDNPIDVVSMNLNLVDKNSRFLANIPPNTTAGQLATGYVCRPYRSEIQKLRAIFTWVSEKICWEEDFEGRIDTTRTINTKRGSAEEYAVLVAEMCEAVGIICEVVRGYLKPPGEGPEGHHLPRSNHWWNAVIVENEWRMIDACLASPSNPKRAKYSSVGSSSADHFWFLTVPSEICWTHIPEHHGHQHFCQPVAHEVLLSLPGVCPSFFHDRIEIHNYNSAVGRIQGLEMVQLKVNVPGDIELAAEVEVRSYSKDSDGDTFENGEMVTKRALAQAEWYGGVKRYTIKAVLPGDEGLGTLRVYAGKRGLMHSIKDIPHPLAFAIPISHTGENPPYDFVTRHPTPHAQRHDIYVVQPQCQRLALNNTFVFAVRQHPSASYASGAQSALTPASNPAEPSTPYSPYHRPGSAMSVSASGSVPSNASGTVAGKKPAKLAIQTPGGKILRLMRKEDRKGISSGGSRMADEDASDGGTWETIIKCSETGTWRGLVLADRTARWCVFAEWTCM